jgi:2'-5' RNA ligase
MCWTLLTNIGFVLLSGKYIFRIIIMSAQEIRCFIAIHLPHEVRNRISEYILQLREYSNDVRWVQAENIHLTLKFLGEIDSSRVDQVKQSLNPISDKFSPFILNVSGSGCFPGKKRPRVFWLGMEQGTENPLFGINRWIEDKLEQLNFEKEKRRFSPHLTIGRVRARQQVDFSKLFSFMERTPFLPIEMTVSDISFTQSNLKPTGAEYQVIEKYPLR